MRRGRRAHLQRSRPPLRLAPTKSAAPVPSIGITMSGAGDYDARKAFSRLLRDALGHGSAVWLLLSHVRKLLICSRTEAGLCVAQSGEVFDSEPPPLRGCSEPGFRYEVQERG
jgi:hypothetical protein